MMKTKILSIISIFMLVMSFNACQSPEDFTPAEAKKGLNSFTAQFLNDDKDDNLFTGEIDYTNKVITVVFPYNYPRLSEDVLPQDALKTVHVMASLENNATITPTLLIMDLTKDNYITVTSATGEKTQFKVVAEIRKSAECAITKFVIPSKKLTGIINEDAKTITLISLGDIGSVLADISISHGATVTPNVVTTAINYDQEQALVVTAQDGKTTATYTVKKGVPAKIQSGMRAGSAKLLWTKKLTDVGCSKQHMTTGIATMGEYLLLNERTTGNAVYLDGKTGTVAGTVDISAFAGNLTNFYGTGDDSGNALFVNLTPGGGASLTIWKVNGVSGTPEKFIEYPTGLAMGRKMSIIGSVDGDAIITVPVLSTSGQFARWQVVNGRLVSSTPTMVTAGGLGGWGTNADIIYTDAKSLTSNYVGAYYATPRGATLFSGSSNTILSTAAEVSANWIQNAADCTMFNKVNYVVTNSVNSFTWGTDDSVYMFDIAGNTMDNIPVDFGAKGLNINGLYGAKALGGQNANGTGDVAFQVSSDGFYLYIYFMFTNGYVGCVQCDCIDM
ncbi:MAG: DUF5018 domain-containing protein [Muribaculaceae bacterium]